MVRVASKHPRCFNYSPSIVCTGPLANEAENPSPDMPCELVDFSRISAISSLGAVSGMSETVTIELRITHINR